MSEPKNITINFSTVGLAKIIVVALLLIGLYVIRDIILVVVLSMVLASAMDPLVDWLYRKAKFPRGLSVILVYITFLAIFGLVIYFLLPAIITQFQELGGRLNSFRAELREGTTTFSRVLNQLGIGDTFSELGQRVASVTGNLFETTLGVVSGFVQFIAVLAISFYLIASENGMINFIKSFVPYKHQAYAVSLTKKIETKIGYWLLGQLILSTFIFIMTYIGLTLLGVKFALALALLAGLLEIIPYLGPFLSAIPAVFVAFVQSPPLAIFVILLYILIQETENYVLVPKIMGKTIGANPVIILLAVLIGFQIAGIIGMLLAVPIVGAASVFISDLTEGRQKLEHEEKM